MPRTSIEFDNEIYERIKLQAKAEDRSIAWMLRKLIAEALERREASKEGTTKWAKS